MPTARRILVVDDNRDAATMLAELLALDGHDVRVAHDGGSAIDTARQFLPELVLLDIAMPGMDGYKVARALRARPDTAAACIVALSGYGVDEDPGREHGVMDQHRVKPLERAALQELLDALEAFPSGAAVARHVAQQAGHRARP